MPAVAEKEVVAPEQITLVPVILHGGRGFTTSVMTLDVTVPHVPVTITL